MRYLLCFVLCMICGVAHSACDWSNPGAARYTGDLVKAVYAYGDIPEIDRMELAHKLKTHQFDDFAVIGKSSILGAHDYSDLRDMYWSRGMCNGPVQRDKWKHGHTESALVYCSKGNFCVVVPSACGNLARVTRTTRESGELSFEPPSEGLGGGAGFSAEGGSSLASPVDVAHNSDVPTVRSFATLSKDEAPRSMWFSPFPIFGSSGGGFLVLHPCPVPAVPEPSIIWLFVAGLAILVFNARRRGNRNAST